MWKRMGPAASCTSRVCWLAFFALSHDRLEKTKRSCVPLQSTSLYQEIAVLRPYRPLTNRSIASTPPLGGGWTCSRRCREEADPCAALTAARLFQSGHVHVAEKQGQERDGPQGGSECQDAEAVNHGQLVSCFLDWFQ